MSGSRRKTANWAAKQNRDQYVKQARRQGLRARSVFKLDQIADKYQLIQPQSRVLDLGCAPGSWCQWVSGRVKAENQVLGVDLLEMKAMEKVSFIQGDFSTNPARDQIMAFFRTINADLVLSDMAPNITGIRVKDQADAFEMQNQILELCIEVLKPGGHVLTKVFAGESMNLTRQAFAAQFDQIRMIKPDASRAESREVYLLARGFRRFGGTSEKAD